MSGCHLFMFTLSLSLCLSLQITSAVQRKNNSCGDSRVRWRDVRCGCWVWWGTLRWAPAETDRDRWGPLAFTAGNPVSISELHSPDQTLPDLNITPLMLILIYCLLKSNASSSQAIVWFSTPQVQCLTLLLLHHVASRPMLTFGAF